MVIKILLSLSANFALAERKKKTGQNPSFPLVIVSLCPLVSSVWVKR